MHYFWTQMKFWRYFCGKILFKKTSLFRLLHFSSRELFWHVAAKKNTNNYHHTKQIMATMRDNNKIKWKKFMANFFLLLFISVMWDAAWHANYSTYALVVYTTMYGQLFLLRCSISECAKAAYFHQVGWLGDQKAEKLRKTEKNIE